MKPGYKTEKKMARQYDIMVAGHLCLDIIPLFPDTGARSIDQIMRPGKLVNVDDAKISTGGPVSNTALNLKKLGNNVAFCACIGDDVLGKIAMDLLSQTGSTDGFSVLEGKSSSYTVVIAPPGIDRIFLHNPGTNNFFTADDLDAKLIENCRHFHFGYPPLMDKMFGNEGLELQKIFRIAKEAGATTSCDMTLPDPASVSGKAPWRKILENILPYVDMHLPSIEETFYMLHPEEFLEMKKQHDNKELIDFFTPEQYSAVADEVLGLGAKMVTLKSGHRGFYIKTADKAKFAGLGAAKPGNEDNWAGRELWAPAFTVEKFGSATGSGDSSIAGLLSAYLRGLNIEDALKYATCLGYQNVRVLDAVSGIKDWDESTKMIEAKMPLIDPNLKGTTFTHDADREIYHGPGDKA